MKKTYGFILFIWLMVAILFMAIIPSANITSEAKQRYINDEFDEESANKNFKISNLFLSSTIAEGSFGTDIAIPIPIDEKKGREAMISNYTDNSYEDPTIKVNLEHGRFEDTDYHVAYIEILDPSQIRTGLAGKLGSDRSIKITDLAPKFNAIVAINGDFYTQTKAGYIVRQGEVYRKKTSNLLDMLLIDDKGDFHLLPRGKQAQNDSINSILESGEIINGFLFGPALIIDGQVQQIPEDYQFAPHGKNPRAAIAQIGPLKYALLVVDGRLAESEGITMKKLSELMNNLGFKQAYNLDGGNSAGLYFKDSLYSTKSYERERAVSDIIYFCSAVIK